MRKFVKTKEERKEISIYNHKTKTIFLCEIDHQNNIFLEDQEKPIFNKKNLSEDFIICYNEKTDAAQNAIAVANNKNTYKLYF